MDRVEPQAWKHGTDWQWPEENEAGDNGGQKWKGLDKEHVWMTPGHDNSVGLAWRREVWAGSKKNKEEQLGQP